MQTILVLDYGMSNLRSVAKALEHVAGGRARIRISAEPEAVRAADRVVFPGQGAIRECMRRLAAQGLDGAVREALACKPFLGICLGLQTLMQWSDEGGGTDGLGIYAGGVRRFAQPLLDPAHGAVLKVPHMGWNQVWPVRRHPIWSGIEAGERFYFVHSYYVDPVDIALTAATTDYGVAFTSALARDNVFAVQFHPEKSQHAGLRLLENFLAWEG